LAEASILVIEDDEIVSRTIERSLMTSDFRILKANSGVEGLKSAHRSIPDLVILDVIMPGMDGYAVCREMRADSVLSAVPILFLTAKIKDEDKIAGFQAGADDYLSKPFNVDELVLRVRAILRRTKGRSQAQAAGSESGLVDSRPLEGSIPSTSEQHERTDGDAIGGENKTSLVVGRYILNTRSFELHTPHRGKLRLTPVQYDLLYHLMSHPGQTFAPSRLLDEVWDYPSDTGSPDLVRVHIKNLRERVEIVPSSPRFIRTVTGYGYMVSPDN
jgi:two-component system, OmpR family, response regulator RpaA